MPRVRMTAGLIGEDGQDWLPGEVHEATEHYARYLVHRQAAVLVEGEELPPPPPLVTQIVAHDPKPTRRRG